AFADGNLKVERLNSKHLSLNSITTVQSSGYAIDTRADSLSALIEQVPSLPFAFTRQRLTKVPFWPLMLAFLTLCLVNNIAQAQSSAAPRGDNQLWNELQLAVPINKQVDFVLLGVMRLGRNVSRPVYELVGAGISVKVGKYLTLLPSYSYFA